jgi:hypothetical protein
MSDSPEAVLVRALMLVPLPSAMLLGIARHQAGLADARGAMGDTVGDHYRTLIPFEAFAKVLSAYHPAEKKYM